jgi:3alpha-hydroxysteroid 3-dehydrogenase
MTTTLMTGSASGIGAATREALIAAGHTVIGVDLKNADILGDLSTAAGRQAVIQAALERCGHKIDNLVLCAGLGAQTQPASLVTSVNYFGAVELLDGFLPALQKGSNPSAVVISSVASAMMPWDKNPMAAAFTAMDEQAVSQIVMGAGDKGGNLAYAGSKNALDGGNSAARCCVGPRRCSPEQCGAGRHRNPLAPSGPARRSLQRVHQKLLRSHRPPR